MKLKANRTDVLGKIVRSGLIGGGVIVLTMLLLSVLFAYLTDNNVISQQYGGFVSLVLQAVPFFAGGLISSALVSEKKLQTAGITLGVGLFFMIGSVIVFWDGAFDRFFQGILVCTIACAAGVGINLIPRKGKLRVKVRYC